MEDQNTTAEATLQYAMIRAHFAELRDAIAKDDIDKAFAAARRMRLYPDGMAPGVGVGDTVAILRRVAEKMKRGGARLPIDNTTMNPTEVGLSIGLVLVEQEIEEILARHNQQEGRDNG